MVEIPTSGKVRLDAWLWSVRIYKTRSAATTACRAGHVRLNGEPVKASQTVVTGDRIRVRKDGFDRDVEVTGLLSKRVSAPVAAKCYLDHTPPRERVVIPQVPVRDRGTGRPTKKDRREMDRLRASWQGPESEL
ncbi:RNA-binding S4 domain-containing protein [Arthrobacter sp. NIO-1057]|uniref:RNA-binding S4 domain-containing protein n=1 Tax=Arthrobacter sp. NIO-1057 TaxID=993071 RepID=UPI00071D73D6|nr:RNA-binding S4 domain-containing protein [Arthrobacter sp. NIO-1057]KSU64229.1 RNA-binding protein S4 [Arthrobacter sp. NIO-1057]SCC52583.1 heat shock protein Hsp15 [Arthrobacter sp. NIO-1057]